MTLEPVAAVERRPNPSPGRFWHGFADMAALAKSGTLEIERGKGCRVWDSKGSSYLDSTAALWYCAVGYGRAEIADAAAAQMRRLHAYSTFGAYSNRPAEELAARIAELAPIAGAKVFFTSGGSDAVETAVKLARRYWHAVGKPDKRMSSTAPAPTIECTASERASPGSPPTATVWEP